MPSESDLARINDIRQSVVKALEYTRGFTEAGFVAKDELVDAVVYNLVVIGEAAAQITPAFAELHPEVPWRVMRGMRNILVHAYWRVDRHLVWKTVTDDLPQLKTVLDALIASTSPGAT